MGVLLQRISYFFNFFRTYFSCAKTVLALKVALFSTKMSTSYTVLGMRDRETEIYEDFKTSRQKDRKTARQRERETERGEEGDSI